jgi:hypothetical protein
MDPKLAALLARRKQQQDEDGDAGFYMQDAPPDPKPARKSTGIRLT